MLAIVDKHEAEMRTAFVPDETLSDERKLGYRLGVQDVLGSLAGHVKIDPSDERPARERLSKWASDDRNGDMPFYVHAIVEAIDANTAAVKASKS
jgi:hypothetical protein